MTTVTAPASVLSDELIEACGQRAATYARENRFFTEDFGALPAAGYLNVLVPRDLGGPGLSVAELCKEQERLAYRAPATAVAVNMHLYWTGIARFLRESGDPSLEWVLRDSMAGEVFAAGHAETGNDLPGLFGSFMPPLSAVYYGLARRAADLAIASARNKTSLGLTRTMAYHPEVQHLAAEMAIELEAMGAHIERVAADWSNGVDHGAAWGLKLLALKYHCTESAKRVVDLAMTMSGGTGMYKRNELERLYRDVRCGGFHPANPLLAHEFIGKMALGVDISDP